MAKLPNTGCPEYRTNTIKVTFYKYMKFDNLEYNYAPKRSQNHLTGYETAARKWYDKGEHGFETD